MSSDSNAVEVVNELIGKLKSGELEKEIRKKRTKKYTASIIIFTILVSLLIYEKYDYKPSLRNIYVPKSMITDKNKTQVILEQNEQGHYIFVGEINGKKVKFLLDTGATTIGIPEKVARYIGLEKGKEVLYNTANGISKSYETYINSIKVGNIEKHNVRAGISTGMRSDEILFGMSFLKDVELLQKEGKIILTK